MTVSQKSDVDVIVLDLDGGAMLEECLASIERQAVVPSRVIVWDNGSREPVAARLGNRGGLEILRSGTNLGFAGGANAAMREVSAPFVALVNNDVVLEPRWLDALLGEMSTNDRLGGVQCVVLRPDGLVDGAGVDISDGTIRQRGHGGRVDELSGTAWGVSATAALFRVEALREVARGDEVFDERLFAYYEDVELCARLQGAGYELRVLPETLATHRGSFSAEMLGGDALRLRVRNRWLVHRMHPGIGRTLALLAEDVRNLSRAIVRGHLGEALIRIRGMTEGCTRPF